MRFFPPRSWISRGLFALIVCAAGAAHAETVPQTDATFLGLNEQFDAATPGADLRKVLGITEGACRIKIEAVGSPARYLTDRFGFLLVWSDEKVVETMIYPGLSDVELIMKRLPALESQAEYAAADQMMIGKTSTNRSDGTMMLKSANEYRTDTEGVIRLHRSESVFKSDGTAAGVATAHCVIEKSVVGADQLAQNRLPPWMRSNTP